MSREVITGTLSSYKADTRIGYRVILRKSEDAQETASCLRRFLPPFQKPGRIFTDSSKEFSEACQDLAKILGYSGALVVSRCTWIEVTVLPSLSPGLHVRSDGVALLLFRKKDGSGCEASRLLMHSLPCKTRVDC